MIGRAIYAVLALVAAASVCAADPVEDIRNVGIIGGLVAQVGSEHLGLRELGDEFHVRLLLPDAEALAKAQSAIEHAGLQGLFTVSVWDGKVVFHNYQALVCLEAADGRVRWRYDNPIEKRILGTRNLLGHLSIADSKVLWSSSATGGRVCLDLKDGRLLWRSNKGTSDGYNVRHAVRAVRGVIYSDSSRQTPERLEDGTPAPWPNIGDMLNRGRHIRCYMAKATERYLILPYRGAEFVDLKRTNHMAPDWIRGQCSYGVMPANGLLYLTPDPCSCYAGARMTGFFAVAEEWEQSTYYVGPGKLLVHNSADGKLLAEYDLPACPVFNGMSAANGKLLIPMVNGQVQCIATIKK